MEQENNLAIQEVAKITGLSVHTLRYYERIGLLNSVNRNSNGYRLYDSTNIAWIEFLTRLRETGMSINQMQEFSTLRNLGATTISDRRLLLEQHHQMVKNQITKLEQNLIIIEDKVRHYKELEEHHNG